MKSEVAYLITGIKVHSPHADHKQTDTDFGGSHADLKRAVDLYTSFCDSGDNMFAGEIWLNLKNEKTGQVETAIISITNQELFLTVPAQAHDHSTVIHGQSHLADRYPDGCMVEENPNLK